MKKSEDSNSTYLDYAINLGLGHLQANPNASKEDNEAMIAKIEALRKFDIESKKFDDIAL